MGRIRIVSILMRTISDIRYRKLGRPSVETESRYERYWRRKKLNERCGYIEGIIGHMKEHFGLNKIRAILQESENLWIRLGIMAMNIQTSAKRIG